MPDFIQSLEDYFRIERALINHEAGLSQADIARQTGIPASTVSRYLLTMEGYRHAERTADGSWRITSQQMVRHFTPYADRFGRETG